MPNLTARQIILYGLLSVTVFMASCNDRNNNDQNVAGELKEKDRIFNNSLLAHTTKAIDDNIRSIFQDSNGNYWFGTNGDGVYRYDGKAIFQFTDKDGLSNNQVQSIQEDSMGNIWFGTGLFGVTKFDGQRFTSFVNKDNHSAREWKTETGDLWFNAGGGAYRFGSDGLSYLPLAETILASKDSPNLPHILSRYAVYCTLKDAKGNIWLGTQAQGVCRYDGKTFTWFTDKGLLGPAVLGMFEDRNGTIWMGNNGGGLFRYDGKTLVNFTEEKGLGNKDFKASGKSNPNTLARIYSINQDTAGNLWVGTVDAGVWRYDGKNFVNFTTKDGLTGNAVNTIYKDRQGALWFGTDGNGICKFNGKSFVKFIPE